MEQIKKEQRDYLASDDHINWLKQTEQNEDADVVRNDPDPEGWDLYLKACENPKDVVS